MKISKAIQIFLAGWLLLAFSPAEAMEQSCSYYDPMLEYYSSDYVFIGKVVRSSSQKSVNPKVGTYLTFAVAQYLKETQLVDDIIDDVINQSKIDFDEIREYLVYVVASQEDKLLKPCTRTRLLTDADEDISVIGKLVSVDSELKTSALTGQAVGQAHDQKIDEIRLIMQ